MSARRRLACTTFVIALAATPLAAVTAGPANAAPGGNDALQFCRSIQQFFPEGNITGPCVSFFRSHNNNARATVVFFCKTFIVPAGEFATVGRCVSTISSSEV